VVAAVNITKQQKMSRRYKTGNQYMRKIRGSRTPICESSSDTDSEIELTKRRKPHRLNISDDNTDLSEEDVNIRRRGVQSGGDAHSASEEVSSSNIYRLCSTTISHGGGDYSNGTSSELNEPGSSEENNNRRGNTVGSSTVEAVAGPSRANVCSPIPRCKRTAREYQTIQSDSESSDGQTEGERCAVCLARFTGGNIGCPDGCDHSFCLTCIQEWAKNVNTCPVDRQVFSRILVRRSLNGRIVRKIAVENRNVLAEDEQPEPASCSVCGLSDREDVMLLCDGCDTGYHLDCLDPPLYSVPYGDWFCSVCEAEDMLIMAEEAEIDQDELYALIQDNQEAELRYLTAQHEQAAAAAESSSRQRRTTGRQTTAVRQRRQTNRRRQTATRGSARDAVEVNHQHL